MPPAGPDMVTLRFRFPDGKTITWRFTKAATVQDIYNFVFVKMPETGKFMVSKSYPRKDLQNLHESLEQAEIADMESFIVTKF